MLYNDDQIGTENIFEKISNDFKNKLKEHEEEKNKEKEDSFSNKINEDLDIILPDKDEDLISDEFKDEDLISDEFKDEALINAQYLYELLTLSELYIVKLKNQLENTRMAVSMKSERPNEYLETIRNNKKLIKALLPKSAKVSALSDRSYEALLKQQVDIKNFYHNESGIMELILWFIILCNWQQNNNHITPCPPIMPIPPRPPHSHFPPHPPHHRPPHHQRPPHHRPPHNPCQSNCGHHNHSGFPCSDPLCPRLFEQMAIQHLEIMNYINELI